MSSKSKDAIEEEVKLELTPMIDVTFLILIFFMCTLKFKVLEGKLVSFLPTDKGLAATPAVIEFEDAEIILKSPRDSRNNDPYKRIIIFERNGSATPLGRCMEVVKDPREPKNVTFVTDPPETLDNVRAYLRSVFDANPKEAKAKINAKGYVPHVHVVNILNMMVAVGFTDISYSGIPNNLLDQLKTGEFK